MKLELFTSKLIEKIEKIEFLSNRNLMAIKTLSKLRVYRIFEEIKTIKCEQFTWHPTEAIICFWNNNELQFNDLQLDSLTTVNITSEEDLKELKWKEYHGFTLLLLGYASYVEIKLNGQLTVMRVDLGHDQVDELVHINLLAHSSTIQNENTSLVKKSTLLTVQRNGQGRYTAKVTELSFTNDTLKRLAYLSNLDKALNKQISGVNEILRKLGGELKGLQEVFGKMEKIFNAAFEDSKPTELSWKRLLVLGDSSNDILASMIPHIKSVQGVQKGLSTLSVKFSTLFQQLFDLLIHLKVSLSSLSESSRFIPSVPVSISNKVVLDRVTKSLTEYFEVVTTSITGLNSLTTFLESSQTPDYTFPTTTKDLFLYRKFSTELFTSLTTEFRSISVSDHPITFTNPISSFNLQGQFMTSTDDYIITASGPTMYLTSLNGEITSHTFPSDIIHISPSPLLILADLMYSFDLERGESDVVGGYGGKGRGCTGNVGKGMVVAWGDGVEVYDIMDDDDDEMEE